MLDSSGAAIHAAAVALRTTNRLVGLIMRRGVHAWMMTGFTATADPRSAPDIRVTGVDIQDPWYPRLGSIRGHGKEPNTSLSIAALRSAFTARSASRWHPETAGKYVFVAPFDAATWRGRVQTAF